MKHTRTILKNGTRVITVPMPANPTVTVFVGVGTGGFYEDPEKSGISHFLEHMCFKGTTKRPAATAISTELDNMGSVYNAFTDQEITAYYAKADIKHFEKVADIVSDIYLDSIFPDKEIAKEKGVVLGEIDMYNDDNQEKVADALRIHMYKGEPAERSVIGTKETVSSITRDDLIKYRSCQYKAANTAVIIAGGVEETKMLSWAEKAFAKADEGVIGPEFATRDRVQEGPEEVYLDKETDQAHILVSWRTFNKSHPDRYIASVIRAILVGGMSSRLFVRLRDELGSGYYVSASHETRRSFGNFTIATGTTHSRVPEIAAAILAEAKKLCDEDVPNHELAKVKEIMRAGKLMGLETSDSVAEFFGVQEITSDKIRTPEEIDAIIAAITPTDVRRVANFMFDPKKLTFAAIGKGIDKSAVSKALTA
ncbi:MAG: pitrilysin family protein [bacterium]|nr:pitrilysin family protein [bacterium]